MVLAFYILNGFIYFIRSKYSFSIKLKIFSYWFKFIFKSLTLGLIFNLKSESMFGFKVKVAKYRSFCFLFDEIFLRNSYFFESKNKKPIIFDCGANIGIATLFFKWLYPESIIYAFEPDPTSFSILKKNIENNQLKNVYPYQVALSDKDGRLSFYSDSQVEGSVLNSVEEKRIENQADKITVEALALSSIIKKELKAKDKIDFLKIDIEGMETKVISDLTKNKLFDKIKEMVIEYHHKISNDDPCELGKFLSVLEKNNLDYRLDTQYIYKPEDELFQDVNIHVRPI